MAEEEVNYTSVSFTKKHSQSEVKKEETTYDEVKMKDKTTGQTPDTNNKTSDKSISRHRHYQQLACCLGILCVMLVVGIIAVTVYHLTGENQKLKTKWEELETEKENLTVTSRNELNVSRAQWSIDAYCPKDNNNNRQCKTCQDGWEYVEPYCYATNNAEIVQWKTWEEARKDCIGKISDLVVVINEDEKKTVSEKSWEYKNKGYWIGLRVDDGRWKWLDGRNLTNSSWIDQLPSYGRCAISVYSQGFKSVSCDEKNRWICKKKALSV